MPQLLPFAGLRPDPSVVGPLDDVVCPPYDVITAEGRQRLLERSAHNMVRIELPNGNYQQAAAVLAQWRSTGALVREPAPALYGYRMSYVTPSGALGETTGVIGALALERRGRGVLPHEHTTPKAKTDRLELLRATNANTSPIWCLCSERGLTEALGKPPPGLVTARAVDDEGTTHELWPIVDPEVHERVGTVVAARPLLVADGHHRYETAVAYQAERASEKTARAGDNALDAQSAHDRSSPWPGAGPDAGPGAGPGALMALVVELSNEHVQIFAIHRVISSLPAGVDVLTAFRDGFEVAPTDSTGPRLLAEMSAAGAVGIVTIKGPWLARPRPGAPSAAHELDSSRVDDALGALPPHQLTYEHDVSEALAAVGDGRADAALFCRPATVAQIAATARGGELMPPKTTFFWPKLRTGMVLRDW
jgi:uncharacterized protein (DUF1015 family)